MFLFAVDTLMMFFKMDNEMVRARNQTADFRRGAAKPDPMCAVFVTDGTAVHHMERLSFYQRRFLQEGSASVRQGNPNDLKLRLMISGQPAQSELARLLANSSASFQSCAYSDETRKLMQYVTASRKPLQWLLCLEHAGGGRGPFCNGNPVRIISRAFPLRKLLLEFTCLNHATSLVSPQTYENLKPFVRQDGMHAQDTGSAVHTPEYTAEDYSRLRCTAPSALLALVQYSKVPDRLKLVPEGVKLLLLMMQQQQADTTVKLYKTPGSRADSVEQDEDYSAGVDLPKVVSNVTSLAVDYFGCLILPHTHTLTRIYLHTSPAHVLTIFASFACMFHA